MHARNDQRSSSRTDLAIHEEQNSPQLAVALSLSKPKAQCRPRRRAATTSADKSIGLPQIRLPTCAWAGSGGTEAGAAGLHPPSRGSVTFGATCPTAIWARTGTIRTAWTAVARRGGGSQPTQSGSLNASSTCAQAMQYVAERFIVWVSRKVGSRVHALALLSGRHESPLRAQGSAHSRWRGSLRRCSTENCEGLRRSNVGASHMTALVAIDMRVGMGHQQRLDERSLAVPARPRRELAPTASAADSPVAEGPGFDTQRWRGHLLRTVRPT